MLINKLKIKFAKKFLKTLNTPLHTHFDPNCNLVIELDSVRTFINDVENFKISELRHKGIPIQIEYYDSHRFDSRLKYSQSSIPTVLVLSSGEQIIQDYDYLIGNLTKENYRVLVMSFPGILFN